MNIRGLVFGSAAALAVASGARAADAIVAAEPEPMEYVRVCDAYGTGFFYIPGTETCLKWHGIFRYEKRVYKTGHQDETYDNHGRIRFDIEARNDSEWGTVYSWIRLEGNEVNNGSNIDGSGGSDLKWFYFFGIGGLEFGNWDSQWEKFFDYGGFTDDGGIYYDNSLYPSSRQYVSYTAQFGDWKAYVSLDNDADEYYAPRTIIDGVAYHGELHGDTDLNDLHRGRQYMPDVTAGVYGTFGDWQIAGGAAYDESAESVALKGMIAGNFGMFGVRIMPLWSDSAQNIYFNYDAFSLLVGLQAKVTDTITLSKDIQWWDDGSWRIVGDVNWQVASGFSVLFEGIYYNPDEGPDTKSGMLRFERKF